MKLCDGCNNDLDVNDNIQCTQQSCKKQYHLLCVNLNDSTRKPNNWKCPSCSIRAISKQKRAGSNDNTPIKILTSMSEDLESQNITIRHKKPKHTADQESVENIDNRIFSTPCQIIEEIKNILPQILREAINKEFSGIRKEIQSVQDSISFLNSQYEGLKTKVETYSGEIMYLRSENSKLNTRISDIENKLSYMEQDARQNNIEIHCMPEHKEENLNNLMVQLCRVVSHPLDENEIVSCTRVKKSNQTSKIPRIIVCKLQNKLKRDNLLASVLKYNKSHPKEKLNTALLGVAGSVTPVFITEHLTLANKQLHAAARIAAKEKKYKFVWVRNGKIFMRKDENSPAKIVNNLEFLKSLP